MFEIFMLIENVIEIQFVIGKFTSICIILYNLVILKGFCFDHKLQFDIKTLPTFQVIKLQ